MTLVKLLSKVNYHMFMNFNIGYSYLIVNVFLYCFMHLKPARLVSRIWVQFTLHLIGSLWNYLVQITLKLLRVFNCTISLPPAALSWVIDR